VDQRLFFVNGRRPERLTRNETPDLARAMVAFLRGKAKIDRTVVCNVACVRIYGPGINSLVRGDDWINLVPYLKDNSFDWTILPVLHPVVLNPPVIEGTDLDVGDQQLYERILTVLNQLFTVEFPTAM
jgi:hypothetical protein